MADNVIPFPDRNPVITDADTFRDILLSVIGANDFEDARRIACDGLDEVAAMEAANCR